MSDVSLHQLRKHYGSHVAVAGIDLSVSRGEIVTLLGPSGCGKTTCLRMVAGFVEPTSGRVSIGGHDVTKLPPHRRNTGMVFQSYALFPHYTVAENVTFGLRVRRMSRVERDERTREALRLVRLEDFANRYPAQLSGGQRQRVALARAVVIKPEILLLDEPLGALDLKLREELQGEIKRIQSELKMTTLFVTHDQDEALSVSTRIAVMNEGKIIQIGTPSEVYERPNSRYVANFVGKINLIPVTVLTKENENRYRVGLVTAASAEKRASFAVLGPQRHAFVVGDRCLLAVRPEHLRFSSDTTENELQIRVTNVTYFGSVWHIVGQESESGTVTVLARPGEVIPAGGETAKIHWRPEDCFLLQPS